MKNRSLLLKFALIFLGFTVTTLLISGVATYVNQTRIYQAQQEQKLRNIADYLSAVIQADGESFTAYQGYFLTHYGEMDIPTDFQDFSGARARYETLFAARYPGKTLGVNLDFAALAPEVQLAFGVYQHEKYLFLFEQAARSFGLTYAYYIVPTGEALHMYWMLDAVREDRGDGNILLAIDVEEPLEDHKRMWEAWETGAVPDGYDTYGNELGRTYAWYAPLFVDGEKLGLIGTEVGIDDYNRAILHNTLRQLFSIALILVAAAALTLLFIDRAYIAKIRRMSGAVAAYSSNKDAGVARGLEYPVRDELCLLGNQLSAMILELNNYMRSLVKATEELSHTREQVNIESQFARLDALTGIRNRNAYEEEQRRLDRLIQSGKAAFGIAVVDVNFLKRINDTYGHICGNTTIQECCRLVCRVFVHSKVFRIGGDEFAVVFENEDYARAAELTEQFNTALKTRPASGDPGKQLSAAIGYALYDPKRDTSADDVFTRADKAMYRRKKEMKAERT